MYKNAGSDPLYSKITAVTNRHLCTQPLVKQIELICRHRPRGILLREKDLSPEAYMGLAEEVLDICSCYQIDCTLHSFVDVALSLQCSRIHLPLHILRSVQISPRDFSVIGTSVHSLAEAQEAVSLGATYLTAGHIFPTDCKKGLAPRGLSFLTDICSNVPIPVYGIGGIHIDEQQINSVESCGAAGVCIMSDMMKLSDLGRE